MTELIIRLYEQGMTQCEVGQALGISQKMVFGRLRKAGIKCRKAAKRFQNGAANDTWKGDKAGYQAFHRRLDATKGRPKICQRCGTDDPSRRYDWANLSGRYNDPNDYQRLCRSCHWKLDGTHKNFKGAIGGRPSPKGVVSNA